MLAVPPFGLRPPFRAPLGGGRLMVSASPLALVIRMSMKVLKAMRRMMTIMMSTMTSMAGDGGMIRPC